MNFFLYKNIYMLEQLSNEPSPDNNSAAYEVYCEISIEPKYSNISYKFIKSLIINDINKSFPDGLGSYTGWIMWSKRQLTKNLQNNLDEYLKLRNTIKRRLQLKCIFIGKLIILHKNVIQKLYSPNGKFVKEKKIKYKFILKDCMTETNNPLNKI